MSQRKVFLQITGGREFSKPEVKFLADRYREMFDFLTETETKALIFSEPLENLVDEMPEVYGTDPDRTAIIFFMTTSRGESTVSLLRAMLDREAEWKDEKNCTEEILLDLN